MDRVLNNWKPVPGASRRRRRLDADEALSDAYAVVDARDAGICWASGHYTQPGAVLAGARREHHHLKGRRVRPEWVTNPDRIVTVSAEAHKLITLGFLLVEGDDARTTIRFHWSERLKPADRPFVIQSRRRSQQVEHV